MRRPFPVLVVTLAALGLAACGGGAEPAPTGASGPVAVLDRYTDVVAIDGLLDFEATTLDGETVVGADLADRALALWFWAPW